MGSTYKIIELVGTSEESWEEAARTAVKTAGKSLDDLRVAEITRQDVTIEKGEVKSFRVRLNVSFKVVE
jgi:flavin-binding protein dodecin